MFDHHATFVLMALTRFIADAVRCGNTGEAERLSYVLSELEGLFPEAKAELEERYPIQQTK